MTNSHIRKLLCILLALMLLLCGCRDPGLQNGDENGDNTQPGSGSVAVYAHERYRAAMQQIFSATKLSNEAFAVHWVADMASADVVITDTILPEQYSRYRVLEPEKLKVQSMEELILRDSRGVIGLPLLLRIDGFWYDEQLYEDRAAPIPQSIESWKESTLTESHPAVYGQDDGEALFWAVAAPVYLYEGGTAEELSDGNFKNSALLAALERLEQMGADGLLVSSSDARQAFTTTQAGFWIAGDHRLAASYNYKTTLSSWNLTMSLPFHAKEQAACVVRADMVAVKASADQALTDRFLQLLFDQNTLEDLSADTQMPIACRLQYSTGVVPEVAQICYTTLSSPSVKLSYVHCAWSAAHQEKVYEVMLSVVQGNLAAADAAAELITP